MQKIALFFLFVSWFEPLHFPPWVSWHNELWSIFAVLLLAWDGLFKLVKEKDSDALLLPTSILPFVALGAIAAIQFAFDVITFSGDALVIGFYIALCVICMGMGFASGRSTAAMRMAGSGITTSGQGESTVTLLAFTLLAGAFGSAVLAFFQVFELWEGAGWISRMPELRRPGGNLGQPNHLATLLIMGVASLLFLHESSKLRALPSALILLTLCVALAATESRTGVLSFLLLSLWWFVKRKPAGFSLSPWLVMLTNLGFIALFLTWPSIYEFILQMSGGGAEVNTRLGGRWVVWPQLLEAVMQHPWRGWGLGQVAAAHNAVVHAYTTSEPFSYSHNILLDLALGVGVPLTALLTLAIGVWLWRRARATAALLPWYCLALTLPVAIHSMFEFPFAYAYFLVPVMFAMGTLEDLVETKPLIGIGVRTAALLLLGVSVFAAWSVAEYIAVEEDFRVARFEDLRIGKTPADYERPSIVLLTQLSALLDGSRVTPRPEMTADELALARSVALRYPWTATQNRYALSLALNGSPGEAVRQLHVMRAMHGEKRYGAIKAYWNDLARDKYPQLRELTLP
ncbi:MAG: Wzy polymerase domain-containing protein [Polaromonas sp.]|uniref:PglL family O-oligosaccharyltransferase n=1 Tax=Polaromonas sp. TaxID=1869339 RepID=UPI002715F8D6|nr:O-antigen ligase family protein [Polaromonas sp.]MDO9112745.1 Wzy polymerase domain-containing protein [Polaromonas sp.]MDP1885309.1 Wzy polymerase domain-containing protein [Polaromonas sp.]